MELYKNFHWKEADFNSISKIIPGDWKTLSIGEIIENNPKSKIKAGEGKKNGLHPFFNCSEIQTKYINDSLVDGENIFITTGGDFMFSLYFNGKSSYSTDVWSIKIKEHNTKFINYFLKYNFETNQQYFRGFKFKHLDKKGFQKMVLPIPSFEEQKNIVSILSQQETIIEKTKTLIQYLEKRNQFIMDELLSGRLRIKNIDGKCIFYKNQDDNWKKIDINNGITNIPKEWNKENLSDFFNISRGKVISKTYINNNGGTYPVYSSATENNGAIGFINTYMFDGNYLSWTTDGIYAGTLFYRTGKFNCTNVCGLLTLKNNESDLKGLFYLLKYEFPKHVTKLANSKLMSNSVARIEFILPTRDEIIAIKKLLDSLNIEVDLYKNILKEEENKFNFLLEELMSGKLRVKDK